MIANLLPLAPEVSVLPRSFVVLLAVALCLTPTTRVAAEENLGAYIRANYTKTEHLVPMRDGVRLHTVVYTPNDPQGEWPVLLRRTPYGVGPYGASQYRTSLGPHAGFVREKFVFVLQDVRGKRMSEGEFVDMRPQLREGEEGIDESTDTWDTIEWIVDELPRTNGRVGMWGISYPGFYASAGMIDTHPALKAVSPQAPIADWWFDDMHHHGAFAVNLAFNFFSSFGVPRPEPQEKGAPRFDHETDDGYRFFMDLGPMKHANEHYLEGEIPFWNAFVEHPNYDEFWQRRSIIPHLRDIGTNVLVVGGLYDAEDLYGPFATYRSANENNGRADVRLVMGPWSHGQWTRRNGERMGQAWFGFDTSRWYQEHVDLPWFVHHLKDGPDPELPEALVFETGADRWRRFEQWPPETRQERLYVGAGGNLSFEAPEQAGADVFTSDPEHPVPYTQEITTRWARSYMTEDQRFAERRPDVLTWRSDVLSEDVTLAGPITAELFVSTDQFDADWVVKLIDEHPGEVQVEEEGPGGRLELVRGEIFRGRFRNSYERPEPFVPGEVTRVDVPLQGVLHTFQRGHRIVVQVQSSWFPFFDRNPQSWVDNIFEADEEAFVPATHRVHHGPGQSTSLRVGVLPPSQ